MKNRIEGLEKIARRLFPEPQGSPERIQISFVSANCKQESGCEACPEEPEGSCEFIKPGPVFSIYGGK